MRERNRRLNGSVLSYHATHGRFGKAIDKCLTKSEFFVTCVIVPALLFLCDQSLARSSLWDMWPCINITIGVRTHQLRVSSQLYTLLIAGDLCGTF